MADQIPGCDPEFIDGYWQRCGACDACKNLADLNALRRTGA
jgi:hypothetical protein